MLLNRALPLYNMRHSKKTSKILLNFLKLEQFVVLDSMTVYLRVISNQVLMF